MLDSAPNRLYSAYRISSRIRIAPPVVEPASTAQRERRADARTHVAGARDTAAGDRHDALNQGIALSHCLGNGCCSSHVLA